MKMFNRSSQNFAEIIDGRNWMHFFLNVNGIINIWSFWGLFAVSLNLKPLCVHTGSKKGSHSRCVHKYQDEEASDSDDEADDNISWNDDTEKGTYSKSEMRIVKAWLNDGMRIVNGRTPYGEGAATRGFSILEYVLSDHIEKILRSRGTEVLRTTSC